MVGYHRTGGFAGFNGTVVVYENGTAGVSRHGDFSEVALGQNDLRKIQSMTASDAFLSLQDEYLPP